MKKILFLRSAAKQEAVSTKDWGSLKGEVATLLGKNYAVSVGLLSELAFLADGEDSRIWSPVQRWDLADFDLVVFRVVGEELEKAIGAAHYLNGKGVPFIDTYLLTQGKGKLAGAFQRTAENLPAPKTFYAEPDILKAIFSHRPIFKYPFVLKDDLGRKGRSNYLIKSFAELSKTLKLNENIRMLAQEYIPNDGDLRILVLAGKSRLAIMRTAVDGTHLNNTSMGGTANLVGLNTLSKQMLDDCERAAKLEKLEVAGIDLMVDKNTGKHYLIEVNRAPQLATGAFTHSKLGVYTKMIDEIVTANKNHPKQPSRLTRIGRVEYVSFPEITLKKHPVKIDTGADSSSVHATNISEDYTGLSANILGGKLHFSPSQYTVTRVENSFGHRETRYKVKLLIKIKGRTIRGTFTLAARSGKTYHVLLGRRLLAGKFLVDVKSGSPLTNKERLHSKALQAELNKVK